MGAEKRCVDECPNELKLTDTSVTRGTCRTCAEVTATEANPNGERPFWDFAAETCVAACDKISVNNVCGTCEEIFRNNRKYVEDNQCVERCSKKTYL